MISDTFDLSFDVNKMSSHMHMKSLMVPALCIVLSFFTLKHFQDMFRLYLLDYKDKKYG